MYPPAVQFRVTVGWMVCLYILFAQENRLGSEVSGDRVCFNFIDDERLQTEYLNLEHVFGGLEASFASVDLPFEDEGLQGTCCEFLQIGLSSIRWLVFNFLVPDPQVSTTFRDIASYIVHSYRNFAFACNVFSLPPIPTTRIRPRIPPFGSFKIEPEVCSSVASF